MATALGLDASDLSSYLTSAQPRQLVSFDEMTENHHGDESLPLTERLSDPHAATPDASILSAEVRRHMVQCLTSLPKTQATVIVLYYFQNVPLRDVADVLAVTPSRVSQLHQQALGRLKQSWLRAQALA